MVNYILGWISFPFTLILLHLGVMMYRAIRDTLKWLRVPLNDGVSKWAYGWILCRMFKSNLRDQLKSWPNKVENSPEFYS